VQSAAVTRLNDRLLSRSFAAANTNMPKNGADWIASASMVVEQFIKQDLRSRW